MYLGIFSMFERPVNFKSLFGVKVSSQSRKFEFNVFSMINLDFFS